MTDRITTLKIYLLKSFLWWLVIAWFALATLGIRDHWRGIWVELCLIPMGAYSLSWTMPRRWIFIYGCGCSLSLMGRLHFLLRSWYVAQTTELVLALWLIGLVFLLGLGCYLVSLFHEAVHFPKSKSREPGYHTGRLLLATTISFFFLLSSTLYLTSQREFLANPFTGPQVTFTLPLLTASAISLGYFLLFVTGDRQVRNSCFTPGGVLLISIATMTIYRWIALASLMITTSKETIHTTASSCEGFTTTGMLSATLLLGLHVYLRSIWRLPLTMIAASYAVAAFLGTGPHSLHHNVSFMLTLVAMACLIGYAYRYRHTSVMDRVGWLGVGCYLGTAIVSFA